MNQILLSPSDILFFRDGRPIGGSLSGHGAAWPLPNVINAAIHAALWRSGLAEQAHVHQRARSGRILYEDRNHHGEKFGSLVTAGPFPVSKSGSVHTWFFPAPADAWCPLRDHAGENSSKCDAIMRAFAPSLAVPGCTSSAPLPLAVASLRPPDKSKAPAWWSEGAWNTYLGTEMRDASATRVLCMSDAEFSDAEALIGIGIDAARGTQDGTRIYSAQYLRLRENWRLGLFAATADKFSDPNKRGLRADFIKQLISEGTRILVGGQQRLCTAELFPSAQDERLPLPLGKCADFSTADFDGSTCHLVKWVLLSPAIYPEIKSGKGKDGRDILPHSGGWLPTWISDDADHRVLLPRPLQPRAVASMSRDEYRAQVRAQASIDARLVAALIPKPIPVTGWSLGDQRFGDEAKAGAKPTHLAVPAGAVYYFACNTAEAAQDLSNALNWHGDSPGTHIRNRRSTLVGEKGFGLGACGTWTPHPHTQL